MKSRWRSLDFILRAMRSFWRVLRRGLSGPLLGSKPCSSSHLWPWISQSIQWLQALHDPLSPKCHLSNLFSSCSFPPYSLLQVHWVPCCSLNVPGPLPPQGLYTCSSLSDVFFSPRPPYVHTGVRSVQAQGPVLRGALCLL